MSVVVVYQSAATPTKKSTAELRSAPWPNFHPGPETTGSRSFRHGDAKLEGRSWPR